MPTLLQVGLLVDTETGSVRCVPSRSVTVTLQSLDGIGNVQVAPPCVKASSWHETETPQFVVTPMTPHEEEKLPACSQPNPESNNPIPAQQPSSVTPDASATATRSILRFRWTDGRFELVSISISEG
jgi:hypothetical protein